MLNLITKFVFYNKMLLMNNLIVVSKCKTYIRLKYFIFLIFIFFFAKPTAVFAQKEKTMSSYSTNKHFINWKGIISEKISDEEDLDFLYFENAVFKDNISPIPYYFERQKIGSNQIISNAKIMNPEFAELTFEEAQLIIKSNYDIPSEIKLVTEIRYEKKKPFANVSFIPIRKNASSGKFEKLVSFELKVETEENKTKKDYFQKDWASNSLLKNGNYYKIGVQADGIYKITFEDLTTMGFDPASVDPRNIHIYGKGGEMLPELNGSYRHDDLPENSIWVEGENDGVFNPGDYVLFYGQSPTRWKYDTIQHHFAHITNYYADVTNYFFSVDAVLGKRISNQSSVITPATNNVTTFDDYGCHEKDSVNLIMSGKKWYGEYFDVITSYGFSLNFPNIVVGSPVHFTTFIAARNSATSTNMNINVNGNAGLLTIGSVTPSLSSDYAKEESLDINFTATTGTFNVNISKLTTSSIAWLNYFEMNVRRQLIFTGSQTIFRDAASIGIGKVSEFTLANANSSVQLWDVTNPTEVKKQEAVLSGSNLVFRLPTDTLKEFISFNGSDYYTPTFEGHVTNQNLHGIEQTDMIIVVHPDFISEAQRLADLHRTYDNITVVVVTPQQIYNEFSSGMQDLSAIRDFVKMFYDRAQADSTKFPKYLLLFGDASYDLKNRLSGNTNYIPTYQSDQSLNTGNSWCTDDFFGLLDSNEGVGSYGDLDVGIGRFPVKTLDEAKTAVDKVERYLVRCDQPIQGNCTQFSNTVARMADWRNTICFVADDEDGNLHVSQAETMANYIDTKYNNYNIDKIYFDAYQELFTPGGQRYPDVTDAINKRVEKGALIVNYTGHGGELGWAHERVLEVYHINSWNNTCNMPVFITATCEFSRFDDPVRTSAGEWVFLNPNGGGISLFTTSRLSYASSNFTLNQNFYKFSFVQENGQYPKMGDNIRNAKVASSSGSAIRNFVLLGDPALSLAFAKDSIFTDSIITSNGTDTLKALTKVTVTGKIASRNGTILTNYYGTLFPTVYDKKQTVTTLGNDPQSYSMPFYLQKNIIYKGKVSVKNGKFSFSFYVPKDIAYNYGFGRISYYAKTDTSDATGFDESIIIGGSDNYAPIDNTGPDVKLYLDDLKFVFGGITNENPLLLSLAKDEHGINTVGNGIGHDIVATLDEDNNKSFILNDYYEADLDSFNSGTIKYPFSSLSDGNHSLRLKLWDVFNNSTEAYTEFIVSTSAALALNHVFNYPNPFTTHTSFCFDHNQPCCEIDVMVQIFTITGKLIKTIDANIQTSGFRIEPNQITWDGRDDFGDRIGQGVYIYKLSVKGTEEKTAEVIQKLVILK